MISDDINADEEKLGDVDLEKKSFSDYLIIPFDSKIYFAFYLLVVLTSLVSPYVYAMMAAFRSKEEDPNYLIISYVFETIFFLYIVSNFFIEYIEGKNGIFSKILPVRDLKLIAFRYLKGNFIYDIIPFLPLERFVMAGSRHHRLWYLVKCMRLVKGFALFNPNRILAAFKHFQKQRL